MNAIPFHLIHNIQTIRPFVFQPNLNRSLGPRNGITCFGTLFSLTREERISSYQRLGFENDPNKYQTVTQNLDTT